MITTMGVSLFFADKEEFALGVSGLITFITGVILFYITKGAKRDLGKREGFLIVTFGWIVVSIFSAFPYIFSEMINGFSAAVFEAVSGLTTTGASVLTDIEVVHPSILLWRSLTQWFGGMGIIVLTVAILPLLGVGGVELFVAEAPGPTNDKIHPRIKDVAKRLWFIYLGLTVILTL